MALESTVNITRPGQDGGTGSVSALHIAQYTGVLHETIARRSVMRPFINVQQLQGTSIAQSYALGESTLQALVPGVTPDGTVNKLGKNTLSIDTVILARDFLPMLDSFQTNLPVREGIGREHGKKMAKFIDQAFFIQAMKAAQLATSKYAGVQGAGYGGGNTVTLSSANDLLDPAKIYAALIDLTIKFEKRDIDPTMDDLMFVVRPDEFHLLAQNELLINTEYITSEGNKIQADVLKARGIPIVRSNNFPAQSVITGHLLSNAANTNAYDGDFTKFAIGAFTPKALLAAEAIPIKTAVWWDEKMKVWYIDAYTSFGVTPDRADYAGGILLP